MDELQKIHPLRKGSAGWCYAAIGIILWDALAGEEEQLTHAFRRGYRSHRILVGFVWMYITGHLVGAIPDQYDVIHQAGLAYRGRINEYQNSIRED